MVSKRQSVPIEIQGCTAKSIIDKCDVAAIVSKPTREELKLLEKTLKGNSQLGKNNPNVCMSVYKNRGGKYNNVKIWLDIDYATMRVSDLFVTGYDNDILTIEQNYVRVTEDNKVHVFTDKEALRHYKSKAVSEMSSIADDSDYYSEEISQKEKERLIKHMEETAGSSLLDSVNDMDDDYDNEENDFDY